MVGCVKHLGLTLHLSQTELSALRGKHVHWAKEGLAKRGSHS